MNFNNVHFQLQEVSGKSTPMGSSIEWSFTSSQKQNWVTISSATTSESVEYFANVRKMDSYDVVVLEICTY